MTDELRENPVIETPKEKSFLEQVHERAAEARKMRKTAPLTSSRGEIRVQAKQVLAIANEDQGGKNDVKGGMHRLLDAGDRQTMIRRASKGYEPVLKDGGYLRNETDLVYEIPAELYEADLAENKIISDKMVHGKITGDYEAAKENMVSTGESVQVVTGADTGVNAPVKRVPGRPRENT